MSAEGWRDRAACRTHGPEMFFPPRGGVDQWETALAICAGCDVREACLEYAMSNRIAIGVWGGHSAESRRRLARKRRREPAGAPPGAPERILPRYGAA